MIENTWDCIPYIKEQKPVYLYLFLGTLCLFMRSLKHNSLLNFSLRKILLSTEKQVHAVAVVGTHCPKFVEKLHEQLDKRELKVSLHFSFFVC